MHISNGHAQNCLLLRVCMSVCRRAGFLSASVVIETTPSDHVNFAHVKSSSRAKPRGEPLNCEQSLLHYTSSDTSLSHHRMLRPRVTSQDVASTRQPSSPATKLRRTSSQSEHTSSVHHTTLAAKLSHKMLHDGPVVAASTGLTISHEDADGDHVGTAAVWTSARSCSSPGDLERCDEAWCPPGWREIYDNVVKMRRQRDAVVDTMGAHTYMQRSHLPPQVCRLHVLVSLVLSSQTRDEINHAAVHRLASALCDRVSGGVSGGVSDGVSDRVSDRVSDGVYGALTVSALLDIDQGELAELLRPVGFYRRKAEYLKQICGVLRAQYNDDIPGCVGQLCQLPGIGPKMAHLCMQVAWGVDTGIAVDTHVHRIINRLGFVRNSTSTPELTRRALQLWLPVKLWTEINPLLVGFGQQICTAMRPRCSQCLNVHVCPAARLHVSESRAKSS